VAAGFNRAIGVFLYFSREKRQIVFENNAGIVRRQVLKVALP